MNFVDNGDGTASLSGTPAAGTAGIYSITITATNGVGSPATQTFTLTVDAAPAITSANSATFTEGSAGTFTVTSTGLPTATLSETGALPTGVTFTDNGDGTATLAGTPTEEGVYTFTIDASNGVTPGRHPVLHPHRGRPAGHHLGRQRHLHRRQRRVLHGDHHGDAHGVAVGERRHGLPTGVSFTDNGDGTATLAGTPAAGTNGTYTFTIDATNGFAPDATQTFTLTVDGAPHHHLGRQRHLHRRQRRVLHGDHHGHAHTVPVGDRGAARPG